MKNIVLATAFTFALGTTTAQAQFFEGFSGEAALTGSKTTGNTDTTDAGLALKLEKAGENWTHKVKASADFGESNDVTNKKRYALGYQIDRQLTDRSYVYGNADYFSDDFGSYQEGYFLGGGYGYSVLVDSPVTWDLEAGLGFRSQKEQGVLGVREDELAARYTSDFDWVFNDNVSLYNDTELTYAQSDTNIWNETGITSQIAGNLAARVSFRVDHHTDVPVGIEKTDTITRVGIVYTMK
ncbi:putative salt-induced outer membrane protein [Litorimonas taeanensis]|uniref:Putative salt-induced outer membrane protein n=2 Tax=Litorimonas taeanensis TaxID=568099 RepID=A0A420WKI1_9PROT|nr:putative salt-induced outer membrane protein [Litorimonas taeanensis]